MKKITATLIIIAMLFVFAVSGAQAAATGTMTVSADQLITNLNTGKTYRIITLSCTSTATPAFSYTLSDTHTGLKHGPVTGWYAYKVVTKPGTTAPTDASDLVATNDTTSEDLLGSNGTDLIDNTSTLSAPFSSGGQNMLQPLWITTTFTVTNNAVASATFTIWLVLVSG